MDNDSMVWINRMEEEVLNSFSSLYELECGSNDYNYNYDNNSNNFLYDIGYPLYGDEFISNDKYGDAICCRGSESCSDTAILFSNLGNIYCTGEFSCGVAQSIWTGDYTDTIGQRRDVTIFCMAYQACYASNLGYLFFYIFVIFIVICIVICLLSDPLQVRNHPKITSFLNKDGSNPKFFQKQRHTYDIILGDGVILEISRIKTTLFLDDSLQPLITLVHKVQTSYLTLVCLTNCTF